MVQQTRRVTQVSSAAMKSAMPKVAATRGGISSRLPIGVATRYKVLKAKTAPLTDIIYYYTRNRNDTQEPETEFRV